MAETLGSLCDKLSIVQLKKYHSSDEEKLASLEVQNQQLITEINEFIEDAGSGHIPIERLSFASNKVHKKSYELGTFEKTFGALIAQLAQANCDLWHEQEKVYDIEAVPSEAKNVLIGNLAKLNLRRTGCIDNIDRLFQGLMTKARSLTTS